jgi:hypothetical protein
LRATASSTCGESQQKIISSNQPILSYDDFSQLQARRQTTGKALAYAEGNIGVQSSVAQQSLPSIYLSAPVWPLTDPSEALLLRHFVQNLATWVSFPTTSVD